MNLMYGIFTGGHYQKSTIRLSHHMKLVPHSGPIPSFYRMILPSLLTCKKPHQHLLSKPQQSQITFPTTLFSVGPSGKHTHLLDFTSLCRYKWPNTPLKLNNGCAHWWILAIQFPPLPCPGDNFS